MREYEYTIFETPMPTASKEQLKALGMDGWLLQVVYQWQSKWYYVLAREAKPV